MKASKIYTSIKKKKEKGKEKEKEKEKEKSKAKKQRHDDAGARAGSGAVTEVEGIAFDSNGGYSRRDIDRRRNVAASDSARGQRHQRPRN